MGFFGDLFNKLTGKMTSKEREAYESAQKNKISQWNIEKESTNSMLVVAQSASGFSEGFAMIQSFDNKYKFFISSDGKKLLGPYNDVGTFNDGLAPVKIGGSIYFINKDGKIVLGPYQDTASLFMTNFYNGYAIVRVRNSIYGYSFAVINTKGEIIIDHLKYNDKMCKFREGFFVLYFDDGFYYVNEKGEKILGPYQEAYGFSEGLAIIKENEKFWFIDKSGKKVLGPYFDANNFSEGLAFVQPTEESGGFIEKDGRFVWGPENDADYAWGWFESSHEGFAKLAVWGDGQYLVDVENGEYEFGPFASCSRFHNGYSIVTDHKNNEYIIDRQGNKCGTLMGKSYSDLFMNTGFNDGWLMVYSTGSTPIPNPAPYSFSPKTYEDHYFINLNGEFLHFGLDAYRQFRDKDLKPQKLEWARTENRTSEENARRNNLTKLSRYPNGFYVRVGGYTLLLPLWYLKDYAEKEKNGESDIEFLKKVLIKEKLWHSWKIFSENNEDDKLSYFYLDEDAYMTTTDIPCFYAPDSLINYKGNPFNYDPDNQDTRRPIDRIRWGDSHIDYDKFVGLFNLLNWANNWKDRPDLKMQSEPIGPEELINKINHFTTFIYDINIDDIIFLSNEEKDVLGDFEKHILGLVSAKNSQKPIQKQELNENNKLSEIHVVGVQFDTYRNGCYYYLGDNSLYNLGDRVLVNTANNGQQEAKVVFRKIYKNNETPPYPVGMMKSVIRKI